MQREHQPPAGRHPFETLTPDLVMDAVESQRYLCDRRVFALNSYENRVYQVGIEDESPLIAKFYRPERWSDEQILEEHAFCFELAEQELPVVAPLRNPRNESLFKYGGFRFALFTRRGGHAPEFDNLDNLFILGRLLGRIHLIGASGHFSHRPPLDSDSFGRAGIPLLLEQFVPTEYRENYRLLAGELLERVDEIFAAAGGLRLIRTHGDCHAGNILWRDDNPQFVDFDDARSAPAIQDLWMLLSGDRPRQLAQLDAILEGYGQFMEFDPRELRLIESLRSLRMLHHSAWLARRWDDPSFHHHFPWFNTVAYWGEQILHLREQLSALQEEPLSLPG